MFSKNEDEQVRLLNGIEDLYGGVVEIKEYMNSHIFIPLLGGFIK